ncbi:MAG TPA: hypothetical protein VFT49_03430 [Candidatus Saccharimonadales bacterium]|nr:hypothetical protein [Candidatus Saccharimonadales bacterium]
MLKSYFGLAFNAFFGCVNGVDKAWKAVAQTFNLITLVHNVLLKISRMFAVVRFLNSLYSQVFSIFAQAKLVKLPLFGVVFYPFSARSINTNKLNRGFNL